MSNVSGIMLNFQCTFLNTVRWALLSTFLFLFFTWGKWDSESLGDLMKVTQLGNGKTRTETLKSTSDLILYIVSEWIIYLDSDMLAYCTSNVVVDNWIFQNSKHNSWRNQIFKLSIDRSRNLSKTDAWLSAYSGTELYVRVYTLGIA